MGEDFVKKCAKNFFDDISSDSDSRKRYLDSVYKILEYEVNRYCMSERWLPPHEDLAKELVRDNTITTEDEVTSSISDADLVILLDTSKATNPKLYLAVEFIALHGLRFSESATLEVRNGNKLFVGSIKKNVQNESKKNPPRKVFALDILGRKGLGNELVAQYKSGLVELPEAIENQIKVV